jgi:hypothetical protein
MTLEELQHLFRFQTTADKDFTPTDTVDYLLINNGNKIPKSHPIDKLDTLLPTLTDEGYVFEGYRDRTVIFIIPEVHVAL